MKRLKRLIILILLTPVFLALAALMAVSFALSILVYFYSLPLKEL
jgi:flagellar basal body-associated protein FliL